MLLFVNINFFLLYMYRLIKIEFYSEERIFHRDGSCDDTVSILHVLSEEEIEVCIRAICDSTFYYDRSTDKAYPGFIFYYEDITKNTTYNEGRIYLHYNNQLKGNVSEGYWKGPILDLLDQYINKYID